MRNAGASMNRKAPSWPTLALVFAVVITGGCRNPFPEPGKPIVAQAAARSISATPQSVGSTAAEGIDFSALVEACGAAVVNVSVIRQFPSAPAGPAEAPDDDPFGEFLRRFGIPLPFGHAPNVPLRGMGSGFIVSPDGYVLTSAHVVANASRVTVKLADRREFHAKAVGSDLRSDVAVLKIDAHDLPVVRFGDARALKPGQWVVAIGSPFGFEHSVTAGIVSGTARTLPNGGYVPFIQTDAAVNPGNSGGPLFNLQGEVIGINSQIVSRSGGYMGISFAIPIDVARSVQEQLIRTGRVERGRIGVVAQDVTAGLAESFGLERPRGALVSAVDEDGPADDAGLAPGDIILQVDGHEVELSGELAALIAALKPGSTVTLHIWRNRAPVNVSVRVAALDEATTRPPATAKHGGQDSALGLAVRPLTPAERDPRQRAATSWS